MKNTRLRVLEALDESTIEGAANNVIALFDERDKERDEQYLELVAKVIAWEDWYSSKTGMYASSGKEQGDALQKALQPHLPPKPSLSDDLYKESLLYPEGSIARSNHMNFVDRARQLEDKLKAVEGG